LESVISGVIWKGIVKQESISELLIDADTTDEELIVKLTIASYDSEFKEYYQNKKLNTVTGIQYNSDVLTLNPGVTYRYWFGGNTISTFRLENIQLYVLLMQIFPNVPLDMEYSLQSILVSRRGFLAQRNEQGNNNYVWIKLGFERIQDTSETCYGFLEKICNVMGWDFYSYNGRLRVENRCKQTTTTKVISANDFKNLSIKKDKAEKTYKHLIIPDGGIVASLDHPFRTHIERYRTRIVQKLYKEYGVNHFEKFWSGVPAQTNGYSFIRYDMQDTEIYRMVIKTVGVQGYDNFLDRFVTLNIDDLLSINGGDMGNYMVAFKPSNNANFLYESGVTPVLSDSEFAFSGNYANCLFTVEDNRVITYDDYCKTDLYFNNFAPLLSSKAITLRLIGELNELILDYTQIEITDDVNLNGNYMIDKFKADIETDTTKLELIKLQ
jgi:hypothetical protein